MSADAGSFGYGLGMRLTQQDPQPVHSFSEPVWQTGSRWHIRLVSADGARFPHGGLASDAAALCGLELARGWDLSPAVTVEFVRGLQARNESAGPDGQAVCGGCAAAYLAVVSA